MTQKNFRSDLIKLIEMERPDDEWVIRLSFVRIKNRLTRWLNDSEIILIIDWDCLFFGRISDTWLLFEIFSTTTFNN